MPAALGRFIACFSAFKPAPSIVFGRASLTECLNVAKCCNFIPNRRAYSKEVGPFVKHGWPRWRESEGDNSFQFKLQQDSGVKDEGDANQAETVYDAAYWATTLAHQERLKRLQGIKTIWKALCYRKYKLPTDDTPDAEFLWGTFIKNPTLVADVIDHAAEILRETGKIYSRLYEVTMRYWLPRVPKNALDFHHKMLIKLGMREFPLRELARMGPSTLKLPAYEALMEIYRTSNERGLFDDVVPPLIENDFIPMARRWYALCIFRHDIPSEHVALHPVIQIFSAEASTISESKHEVNKYNTRLKKRLLGRDTAPVRFNDSFCARMFATRALHPCSIIQGLVMVGVNEIGPQAVRAMASRTLPLEELPMRFEELQAAGIALQGSVFSLALEKFAMERKWHLVRSMLDSDQHPDVFGDADIQRKLLEYYLDQKDFGQAQRALAILTLFHNDPSTESWNLLLQIQVQRYGPEHVTELLQDMRTRGIMLLPESINTLRSLLRPRQIGRKPGLSIRGNFDDLRFVTRVFMMVLENGMGAISPSAWREITCRFGMLGRFRELRRLLFWLLCWYAPRGSGQFAYLPEPPLLKQATKKLHAAYPERNQYFYFPGSVTQAENPFHPIRLIFKPSFLQALISWGFRAGVLPNANLEQSLFGSPLEKKCYRRRLLQKQILRRLDWSIGLRTVVLLRDYGVHMQTQTVVKALQMQFISLFGRGRSSKKENRVMEQANTIRYAHFVEEVNKIWGSPLLRDPQLFAKGGVLHLHMWHPRMRRVVNRKSSISLAEALGSDWQNRVGREDLFEQISVVREDEREVLRELKQRFAAQQRALDAGPDFLKKKTKDYGA